ncbi:MarR family transcriptional regulator [Alistipes sp. kh20]|uniref:MarR family winged helix-turn-helix transcriptional regulator n=1 Tax=Alistipes montrealensis TaxID=2834113 RepID=UPI001BCBCB26|nr:MarR family transcriptional regulator [Alistipes montrealensis]MBS4766370.1 MarR family transcriptional regulator [Alistipes montrealensis]
MTNSEQAHELMLQIIRTRRAFRQTVQRMLRSHNVEMTFEMLQVMYRLWEQQGISQQQLAQLTSKDKASLTNLINNLVRKGWVARRENAADRRSRLIFLTATGRALAGIVKPILKGIYERAGEHMDAGEMILATACLGKLNGILDEI